MNPLCSWCTRPTLSGFIEHENSVLRICHACCDALARCAHEARRQAAKWPDTTKLDDLLRREEEECERHRRLVTVIGGNVSVTVGTVSQATASLIAGLAWLP